jgi:hypothetical protein
LVKEFHPALQPALVVRTGLSALLQIKEKVGASSKALFQYLDA